MKEIENERNWKSVKNREYTKRKGKQVCCVMRKRNVCKIYCSRKIENIYMKYEWFGFINGAVHKDESFRCRHRRFYVVITQTSRKKKKR